MPDCYNQLLQTNNQAPRKFADRVSMTQILDVVTEALRVAKSNDRNPVGQLGLASPVLAP